MRKNTARHWLHAALDLLPVILIPVFMIYSHRHDLSTDITIQQDVYKDFYQGVKNGKPINSQYYTFDNYSGFENNKIYVFESASFSTVTDFYINENDILFFNFNLSSSSNNVELDIYLNDYEQVIYEDVVSLGKWQYLYTNYVSDTDLHITSLNLDVNVNNFGTYLYISDIEIFNLTQIFGSGNEPTKEVFESYLTQDYYDFGSNEVKVGTIDVQAKNNDIMSVFMDSFNNSVNKYFNMGNVFNMTSVYNWFNTNIFGGTAPVVIYSVWNIVLYEFVMDLLFLLYGLFMWFIDMCKRLIEKPLDSIK